MYDEDIDIHIKIQENDAEIIYPSKKLINPDMQGLEGLIFEEGIIKELLLMFESSDISYDSDISYSIADSLAENQASIRAYFNASGINGNPKYGEEDYEREISNILQYQIPGVRVSLNSLLVLLDQKKKVVRSCVTDKAFER